MAILEFRTIVLKSVIKLLKVKGKTMLGRVGLDLAGSYEGSVENQRVCDAQAGRCTTSRHLEENIQTGEFPYIVRRGKE
jgi:hypothetical protein